MSPSNPNAGHVHPRPITNAMKFVFVWPNTWKILAENSAFTLHTCKEAMLKTDQNRELFIPMHVLYSAKGIIFLHNLLPIFLSPKDNQTATVSELLLAGGYDFCYEKWISVMRKVSFSPFRLEGRVHWGLLVLRCLSCFPAPQHFKNKL